MALPPCAFWPIYQGMKYDFRTDLIYPKVESVTLDSGERTYMTPHGPAPSVTTILGTLPHPELDAWKARLGQVEADRITKEAAEIGSYMHNLLETHVKAEPIPAPQNELQRMATQMFHCVRLIGLQRLEVVWGVETALFVGNLYAGRTDLVGVYDGLASIIDYKTGLYPKKPKFVENYKMQIAAYGLAHEEMFPGANNLIRQGVILVGIRPNEKYKKGPELQKIILTDMEMDDYKLKWLRVVEEYHAGR